MNQLLKSSTSHAMLNDTFPNQEAHIVSHDPASFKSVLMLSSVNSKYDVMVATQSKEYGNVNPLNDKGNDKTTSSPTSPLNPTLPMIPMELTINPPKRIIHKFAFNPQETIA